MYASSERDEAFSKGAPVMVAWAWAAASALVGILGFLPDPVAGESVFLLTNTSHSFVYVKIAAAFAGVALAGNLASIRFAKTFGGFYLVVVVVGCVLSSGAPRGCVLGLTDLPVLDNFLHLGTGAAILASGYIAATRI
jgi:hypothetical protein